MFDLHHIVRAARSRINASRVILGAAFDLAESFCEELATEGIISGYLLNKSSDVGQAKERHAGWWLDRHSGRWQPRHIGRASVLLLGFPLGHRLPGDMLLAARLAGIDRIAFAHHDGSIQQTLDMHSELTRRLGQADDVSNSIVRDYESAYQLMTSMIGDRLRINAHDIVQGRIVILTNLSPGGSERQAAYTAIGLAKSGECEVIILSDSLDHPKDFYLPWVRASGVKVVTPQAFIEDCEAAEIVSIRAELEKLDHLRFGAIFQMVLEYAMALKSLKPSLLHTWLDYNNVLGGVAGQLVGIPALLLGGRSVSPTNFPTVFQPYMKPGYEFILRHRSAKMVNNSSAGAEDYCRWLDLPDGSIKVVQNGFDFPPAQLKAERARIRHELGIAENVQLIGTIFRFSEEKRPRLFLETAIAVLQHNSEVQFVAYGAGPLLEAARDFVAREGVADVIKLPGLTSDSWASLAAMDVFVLTSRMEGLPNVLIEAQASGLPVVCTGVGGMNETFEEGVTGFAVPEATPEALARVVARLLNDARLRERMSEAARVFARTKFDREKMIEETLNVYGQLGFDRMKTI